MYKQHLRHSNIQQFNSVVYSVLFSYFSDESAYFRGVKSCDQVDKDYFSLLCLSATLNMPLFVMNMVTLFLVMDYVDVSFKPWIYQKHILLFNNLSH